MNLPRRNKSISTEYFLKRSEEYLKPSKSAKRMFPDKQLEVNLPKGIARYEPVSEASSSKNRIFPQKFEENVYKEIKGKSNISPQKTHLKHFPMNYISNVNFNYENYDNDKNRDEFRKYTGRKVY